jgi:hypothetical protein
MKQIEVGIIGASRCASRCDGIRAGARAHHPAWSRAA